MRQKTRWTVVASVIAGLPFAACQRAPAGAPHTKPAHVEHIEGAEVSRITLTEKAAERLDIETAAVREVRAARSGALRKAVPYAAVLYDANGRTWVYTSPEALTFVRAPIVVDYIDDDLALLAEGPPVGTMVVTLGAAELFGAEFEIGH